AEGLLMEAELAGAPAPPELARLAEVARHATRACREIAHGLSPLGGRNGLPDALRNLGARLTGPPGPEISVAMRLDAALTLPQESMEHLYRIAQEALANAMK